MSRAPSEANERESYRAGWRALSELILSGQSFSGEERSCAFLNNRDGTFSTISAVSGFEVPDDGRSLALVDWDFDGDLDIWTSNRTAPRLRFFRNDYPGEVHFVAFRLQGVEANRDGVGARVRIEYRSGSGPINVQAKTLRAGEGFLGQSSKWLHIGLGSGDSTGILRLSVRWPGAEKEEVFSGVDVDRFYRLVQGTGSAEEFQARMVGRVTAVHPSATELPRPPRGARIRLTSKVPLPPLTYETFGGEQVSLGFAGEGAQDGPLLLNLWASWCPPCVAELKSFTREAEALREAGVDILALAVDGVGEDEGDPEKAALFLERIGFPFDGGRATSVLLDTIQIIHDELFETKRSMPIPTSLLVDERGRLAALYRGPVEVPHLLADLESSRLPTGKRVERALPFAGRWMREPDAPSLLPFVSKLIEHGDFEIALEYLERHKARLVLEGGYAGLLYLLGNRYHKRGLFREAEVAYREATVFYPAFSKAHHAVGFKQYGAGNLNGAIESYREAIAGDAPLPESYFMLAVALEDRSGHGKSNEALDHLRQAVRMDPGHLMAWFYLGLIYERRGRTGEALEAYRAALRMNPAFTPAEMRIQRLGGEG